MRRRSVPGIGVMIGIVQSGWWFGIFNDWSDLINLTKFPWVIYYSEQLFSVWIAKNYLDNTGLSI